MVDPVLGSAAAALWVLTPMFVASATATFPKGRGPPMDLGRIWPWDGRRLLGASKTWSGFLCGSLIALPVALLEAQLILWAPPPLRLVPFYGPSVAAALPVAILLTFGAMSGDALGSFLKRRLGRDAGARVLLLDQLPFVVLPVGLGLAFFPAAFGPAFGSLLGLGWLLLFTVGFHFAFNWIGYWAGLKRVPW